VALLGTFTTDFVTRLLELFLDELGRPVDLYQAPYGTLDESVLDPDSDLYRFQPEITLLLVSGEAIRQPPPLLVGEHEVTRYVEQEVARWRGLWKTLRARSSSAIIQSNFNLPTERALGNLDGVTSGGRTHFVRMINRDLASELPAGVTLFDFEYLSAQFGLVHAFDRAVSHASHQPLSFAFLPRYCHTLARLIGAHLGLARKCLVLDLDGTLWAGSVADDGISGLGLGAGSAIGEAFSEFQQYLLRLKERGVILAVASKNDPGQARSVFERHPAMTLRLSDIASFQAGWNDKPDSLQQIARELRIGLDSLVFFDDSPEERHFVRMALPMVKVVEVPDDPSLYAQTLDREQYFEVAGITADAMRRTEYLASDRVRVEAEARFVDYGSYLDSLTLQARVEPLGSASWERVVELVQRTNQFNLRTVRHSRAQLEAMLADGRHTGFAVSLQDRFGSYGLISVVLLETHQDAVFIDTWLMSCRALKKTVEDFVFARIVELSRQRGARWLVGEYRPTDKNVLVANLYSRLGFEKENEEASGRVTWRLPLEATPVVRHHILEVTDREQ
jgi:FkbH-like protein